MFQRRWVAAMLISDPRYHAGRTVLDQDLWRANYEETLLAFLNYHHSVSEGTLPSNPFVMLADENHQDCQTFRKPVKETWFA